MRGRRVESGEGSVIVFARHTKTCPQRADTSGTVDCQCIRWMQFPSGRRKSTKAWTWARAEDAARRELGGVNVPKSTAGITVEKAIEDWLQERDSSKIHNVKARYLTAKLLAWCRRNDIERLNQIEKHALSMWRNQEWKYSKGDSTSLKVHWSVIGSFFAWCSEEDLISANPCPKLKKDFKKKKKKVRPFEPQEIDQLLAAAMSMKGWSEEKRIKMRAMILLMRWSGMAINDAVCFLRSNLKGQHIHNQRHKTEKEFFVPIPQWVADLLRAVHNDDPEYFFWHLHRSGSKRVRRASIVSIFGEQFRDVCQAAGIVGHSHMLRHSFASYHIANGISIDRVAEWLGHDPAETKKTYSHWVPERNEMSIAAMRESWAKMGLDSVGNPIAPIPPIPDAPRPSIQ
jgi:integrase/recombinase XerD